MPKLMQEFLECDSNSVQDKANFLSKVHNFHLEGHSEVVSSML